MREAFPGAWFGWVALAWEAADCQASKAYGRRLEQMGVVGYKPAGISRAPGTGGHGPGACESSMLLLVGALY